MSSNTYTVTATDANGCTASNTTVISEPTLLTVSITAITDELCFGASTGTATALASGGTSGYSYQWSSGNLTASASSLAAGNYTLTVTDGNGCTATSGPHSIIAVVGPTINNAAVSVVNENCSLGNGSISGLVVNGGTPTITYAWTNTSQTTLSISNLSAGSYSLTVTDGNGCTANSGPYTISNVGGPSLNTTNVLLQNQSCNGTLGSITGILCLD